MESKAVVDTVYDEYLLTPDLIQSFNQINDVLSVYISNYVHMLNKFIGILRKVSSLRFERNTLIKYVKKLRFFNDTLANYSFPDSQLAEDQLLKEKVKELGAFYLKVLEILDILNYFLTQSLQSEIISKTLNQNLTLNDTAIVSIEETYNHFIKCVQWMMESLLIDDILLQIEVVQFSFRCAIEDEVDLEQTDDIFLQQVIPVESLQEYEDISFEWEQILSNLVNKLNVEFQSAVNKWQETSEKKK